MQYLIFLCALLLLTNCTSSGNADKGNDEIQTVVITGKKIYSQYCVLCHGVDGKLGLNGSKDLTLSELSIDSVLIQIKNGKGAMLPYKDVLSRAEIDSVTQYIISLRNNE